MDETNAGSSSSWEQWAQNIGGNVISAWTNSTYSQPYELQKMRYQALGPYAYDPGINGKPIAPQNAMGGIPPGVMILGVGVLLMMLLKKD